MKEKLKNFLKWFYPGMNVKRWILLMGFGFLISALGFMVILDFTRLGVIKRFIINFIIVFMKGNYTYPVWLSRIIAVLFILSGIFLLIFGFVKLLNSLFTALLKEKRKDVVHIIHRYRFRWKEKKILSFGGGTGLSNLLKGLKEYPFFPMAVVTVTDDGGSSGRLREELGIPPPGDLRNCIAALSESEEFLKELFQYRFKEGESLQGHSLGNLIIAASMKLKGGLLLGVSELEEALSLSGRVIPVSESILTLIGEFEDGERVVGETNIRKRGGGIKRIFIEPPYAKPTIKVLSEIESAEIITFGPGSLFSSVIPPLLFGPIIDALKRTRAKKAYILNIMTEKGETDNFTASMHVKKIFEHTNGRIFDYIIVNTGKIPDFYLNKYAKNGSTPVVFDEEEIRKMGLKVVKGDFVKIEEGYIRHDPFKIKDTLLKILKR